MNPKRSTLVNNHDVTTRNLLCLVDSYHLIAQSNILVNNW